MKKRIALAAVTMTLLIVQASPAEDLDWSNLWISQAKSWNACPRLRMTPQGPITGATPDNPYFGFNGQFPRSTNGPFPTYGFSCAQSGPHDLRGEKWFVQVISNFKPDKCPSGASDCRLDLIRVCNAQLRDGAHNARPGPCNSTKGAGAGGCEVCTAQEMPPPYTGQ